MGGRRKKRPIGRALIAFVFIGGNYVQFHHCSPRCIIITLLWDVELDLNVEKSFNFNSWWVAPAILCTSTIINPVIWKSCCVLYAIRAVFREHNNRPSLMKTFCHDKACHVFHCVCIFRHIMQFFFTMITANTRLSYKIVSLSSGFKLMDRYSCC